MKENAFLLLACVLLLTACSSVTRTPAPLSPVPSAPATNTPTEPSPPTPTEAPTAIPTPAPIEVAPGEFIPASQIVGYEARDTSGKLIYVEDVHGNWIKATHEVVVPTATAEDWTNVNARLGTDFVINTDGTIAGVEGLNINKENGEVTFNFDGKGPETYHIGNIKTQEINGVKRLLVAGYSWNTETKSWEVFNPGFQIEGPSLAGWFIEADSANGNLLRFHQRALEVLAKQNGFENVDTYMKHLFEGTLKPDKWTFKEVFSNVADVDGDGKKDIYHADGLSLKSAEFTEALKKGEPLTKDRLPDRAGLSYGYLVDSKAAIISFDALNGNGNTTYLPLIIDEEKIWDNGEKKTGRKYTESLARALESGTSDMIWVRVSTYSDDSNPWYINENSIRILKDPIRADRVKAMFNKDIIDPSASLELWGGMVVYVNPLSTFSY